MKKTYSKFWIIAVCSLVYFTSYFARKDFAAAMAGMLSEAVIDKPTAGLIGTVLFAFSGVGQLISGYLGDKIKPTILIISGLGTTAVCNLLMPLVPYSWLMIPVWALNGLAQAMMWPPIVKILSAALRDIDYKGWYTLEACLYLGDFDETNVFRGVCDLYEACAKFEKMVKSE